ncbi:MAG: hypothetical protein OEM02_15985, partial [Desulfobulbaceae bacterium]|nr:hypothetical protein [Desulfobulbaceae bacterium]
TPDDPDDPIIKVKIEFTGPDNNTSYFNPDGTINLSVFNTWLQTQYPGYELEGYTWKAGNNGDPNTHPGEGPWVDFDPNDEWDANNPALHFMDGPDFEWNWGGGTPIINAIVDNSYVDDANVDASILVDFNEGDDDDDDLGDDSVDLETLIDDPSPDDI